MIWCVEDDASIRDIELYTLRSTGFEARGFEDGGAFLAALETERPELVILDVMLPGMDGVELLRRMKATVHLADIPVIMATAKGAEYDKIQSLDLGADDYLPKPFATKEFIARVKALSRRNAGYSDLVLSFGDVQLDCNRYELSCKEQTVRLNNKEFQLTELFLQHPHFVFSSNHLMDKIWGQDSEADMNVVWTYIGFVRKKLRQIGSRVEIRTVRGAGYSLEA